MGKTIEDFRKFDFKEKLNEIIKFYYSSISEDLVKLYININELIYIENKKIIPELFFLLNDFTNQNIKFDDLNTFLMNFYSETISDIVNNKNNDISCEYKIKDLSFAFYVNEKQIDFNNLNQINEIIDEFELNNKNDLDNI